MEEKQALAALGALAHETRLAVFRLLVRQGPAGMPAGEVAARLRRRRSDPLVPPQGAGAGGPDPGDAPAPADPLRDRLRRHARAARLPHARLLPGAPGHLRPSG